MKAQKTPNCSRRSFGSGKAQLQVGSSWKASEIVSVRAGSSSTDASRTKSSCTGAAYDALVPMATGRHKLPPGRPLPLARLGRRRGRRALDADLRKPVEPARQVPVPVPEQLHRRGQEHAADDRRVDQDRGGEPDAELLEEQHRERDEDGE